MNKKCSLLKKEQQKQVEKRIQNILFFHQRSLHEFQIHCLEKAFEKQQIINKMKKLKRMMLKYRKKLAHQRKQKKHIQEASSGLVKHSLFVNLNQENSSYIKSLNYNMNREI
jgi:hypothetical protein